jgi:hypothetical protein
MENENAYYENEQTYVNMNPLKVEQWKLENGTQPLLLERKAYHKHPLLAAGRSVLERIAHTLVRSESREAGIINPRILCVGACPAREVNYCDPDFDHFMMPNLVPGDARRIRQLPPNWKNSSCHHPLGKCDEACPKAFTSAVFVHSAYYPPFEELWKCVSALELGCAFVVGHTFDEAYGAFYDEATYEYIGRDVKMLVKGNDVPYVHQPLPWTIGYSVEGKGFHASLIESRSGTHLWRVSAHMNLPPISPIDFADIRAHATQVGPIQFSSGAKARIVDDAKTVSISIDVNHLYQFGPVLFDETSLDRFILPVNLVAELSAFVMAKPRDSSTLKDVCRRAQEIVKKSRVPIRQQHKSAMAGAVLAFSATIHDEIDLVNTAVNKYGSAFVLYNRLLSLTPVATWKICTILMIAFAAISVGSLIFYVEPDPHHIAGVVVIVIAIICVLLFLLVRQGALMYRRYSTENWYRGVVGEHNASTIEPLLSNYQSASTFPGSHLYKPLPEALNPLAIVTLEEEKQDEHPSQPKIRMYLEGIAFDKTVPTVIEPTQESEHSAVAHRLAMQCPDFNSEVEPWLEAALKLDTFQCMKMSPVLENEVQFNRWVDSLQYPETYKNGLREQWKILMECEPAERPAKVFAKLEKSTKPVNRGDYEPPKLRLIQAPDDDVKTSVGYIIAQVYKFLCNMWTGLEGGDPRVVYCSGKTPDEIGGIVQSFITKWGDVDALENDMRSYDATIGSDLTGYAYRTYQWAGVSDHSLAWLSCTQTRGTTPHGVKFTIETDKKEKRSTKRQVLSGQPDTNLMDTIVCVLVMLAMLIYFFYNGLFRRKFDPKYSFGHLPFLLLVCGDDSIIFMPKGFITDDMKAAGTKFLTMCGLIPEIQIRRTLAECTFCSKLFWPCTNPATGDKTIVLAAMPGRSLYRHAFCTTHAGSMNLAGSTQGSRIDNGHVPVLRLYLDKTKELCVILKKRPNKNVEWSNFKHSSKVYRPNEDTFRMFHDRYGIDSVEAEEVMRDKLTQVDSLPAIIDYRYIERLVYIDMETQSLQDA